MAGGVPRYHRIAEELRARIRRGEPASGAALDNQRALARAFGVTLMTLRQALDVLEREGLIARRHGVGTFVAAPLVDYDILQYRGLAGDLSAQGADVATRLLGARFVAPDRAVAGGLGAGRPGRVLEIARLRSMDGRAVSLQRSYLPPALGEEALKADLARTPLRHVLEFKLGITLGRARESVSAVRLGRREARQLGARLGAAAFRAERVSFDRAGAPVVFDRVFIPGDRFRIVRQLQYPVQGAGT